MPREEQDQAEEQPLHGSDDGDRDDALVAIQDAMRQISARVEAHSSATGRKRGTRARSPDYPAARPYASPVRAVRAID